MDAITLEILRNRLDSIATQMQVTLLRSAVSVIIKEGEDCACGLFRANGELLARACANPVHLGIMGPALAAMLQRVPAVTMTAGDVYILNDPYRGGTHLPDMIMASPVIVDGTVIARMPDGDYRFHDFVDNDGIDLDRRIRIEATVSIRGDEASVDFANSSAQVRGPVNVGFWGAYSAVMFAFRAFTDPDIHSNAGATRPIRMLAPEGCILNPVHPAPVGLRTITAKRVLDVLFGALAKAVPDRAVAASSGSLSVCSFGGTHPDDGKLFGCTDIVAGGMGGRPGKDGIDLIDTDITNSMNIPAEAFEAHYPPRVLKTRYRADSGGPGEFRGGLGIKRLIAVTHGPIRCSYRSDRHATQPWGIKGGLPGASYRTRIFRADGSVQEVPSKQVFILNDGDALEVLSGVAADMATRWTVPSRGSWTTSRTERSPRRRRRVSTAWSWSPMAARSTPPRAPLCEGNGGRSGARCTGPSIAAPGFASDLIDLFAQATVNGIVTAGLYALIAYGVLILLGILNIVNFAHGEFVMVGAYLAYWAFIATGIDPLLIALPVAVVMFLGGMAIYQLGVRSVLQAPPVNQLALTYGISLTLQNLAVILWQSDLRTVDLPYAGLCPCFRVPASVSSVARLHEPCRASASRWRAWIGRHTPCRRFVARSRRCAARAGRPVLMKSGECACRSSRAENSLSSAARAKSDPISANNC